MILKENLLNELSEKGFYIYDSKLTDEKDIINKQLEICAVIGDIREHNEGKQDYVWPIKLKDSSSTIRTFSEHNDQAEFHTDTQYRELPERYMTLCCVQEAVCGGGLTLLLDSQLVLNDIIDQKEFLQSLSLNFPIAIPDVFAVKGNLFIEQPIVSNYPKFRFRYDTFKKGIVLQSSNDKYVKLDIIERLKDILENSPHIISLKLRKGQILIIDNHRILHGRTAYSDPNRLLYRVRVDDFKSKCIV